MENAFTFQDLRVWQKSILFAKAVIELIDGIDTSRKHYRLIEQLEAASSSVAQNIAEGKGRQTTKEYIQFLYIARGSLFEVISLLYLFKELGWLKIEQFKDIELQAKKITKMLNSLIKSMK